ncbi:MAG: flavodoxin family protein, partial [Selenomonadaceae bacterium]|nr:flavodoxin family protein [Selenomonadaceae bacterium]
KDELSPVLEKIKAADAVVFGTPIYFMNISAGMIACLERLLFANYIYSNEIPTVFGKKLPSAFVYTMNMTDRHFVQFNMTERLGITEMFTGRILGVEPKILRAFNTVQFKDYSRYESSIFDPDDKFAYREKQFPVDCKAAFDIGRALVEQ